MILVVNCIIAEKPRKDFDLVTVPYLQTFTSKEIENIHLTNLKQVEDFSKYSHLLLSGSELSASTENDWDAELYFTIRSFIDDEKPVYGICYGHQMIARAILGKKACRRAEIPEFGWHNVALKKSELFSDLKDFYVVQSHYDEVCNLTDDFTILSSSDVCQIQAFQYKNLPVWGTQFHPEMNWERGSAMLNENLETEEAAKKLYRNDVIDPVQTEQNGLIFKTFFNI
jgi:GMP synthase (glutamine-hydrolysing)